MVKDATETLNFDPATLAKVNAVKLMATWANGAPNPPPSENDEKTRSIGEATDKEVAKSQNPVGMDAHPGSDPMMVKAEYKTVKDARAATIQALTALKARARNSDAFKLIDDAIALVETMTSKEEIQTKFMDVVNDAYLENGSAAEGEEQLQQLQAEFEKSDKEVQDDFERLYKDHKITREQMEYLRKERIHLNALPENSPERNKGEESLTKYEKELGIGTGDEKVISDLKKKEDLWKRKEELAGQKTQSYQQQKGQEETVKQDSSLAALRDDDTPSASTNTVKEATKMAVSDATLDDIQVPSGGKDRSSDRTIVKT